MRLLAVIQPLLSEVTEKEKHVVCVLKKIYTRVTEALPHDCYRHCAFEHFQQNPRKTDKLLNNVQFFLVQRMLIHGDINKLAPWAVFFFFF